MGMTITEKILAAHAKSDCVRAGEFVVVEVDKVMSHDVFTPSIIKHFKEDNVWDSSRIVFFCDHEVPAVSESFSNAYDEMKTFAEQQGIKNFHFGEGVCHQLMIELGHIKPASLVIGADSHTVTYGALCAFATGFGAKEMANIWASGTTWLRVPETVQIVLSGKMPKYVYSKDIILKALGELKSDAFVYDAVEFCGEALSELSMDSRFTLTNMVVEMGAKNGIIAIDEIAKEYLLELSIFEFSLLTNDEDAVFKKVIEIDVSALSPQISGPNCIDLVRDVQGLKGTPITQAFIGSCTNGWIEDLRIAARVMKGRKVAKYVKCIVTPASRRIFKQASREGLIDVFLDAGAIVTNPGCGLCFGKTGGVLGEHDVAICSNNRNFKGRMGHKEAQVYLASPATVAASAIAGEIMSPKCFLE